MKRLRYISSGWVTPVVEYESGRFSNHHRADGLIGARVTLGDATHLDVCAINADAAGRFVDEVQPGVKVIWFDRVRIVP